jgi:drug/metabolite transporter (DMT)-like permease
MSPRRVHDIDEEQPLLLVAPREQQQTRNYYDGNITSATASIHNTAEDDALVPVVVNDDDDDVLLKVKSEENNDSKRVVFFSKGHVLLFIVAILYGTLNVCLRGIYALPNPPSASALSTIRGWLAVLCFAPFLLSQKRQSSSSTTKNTTTATTTTTTTTFQLWRVAAELALWNFGAQGLTNVGLMYIESARASFFMQLSVVMTPCLAALVGHKVERNVWFACAFALAGLVIMSKKHIDGGGGGGDMDHQHDAYVGDGDGGISTAPAFALGLGDVLCLCGALSWSTYLFRLSAVGHLYDEVHLQAIKTFVLAVLYSIWCSVEAVIRHGESQWLGWTSITAWALLFYSALGPGTVADVLQQQGQSHVTATVANIILSLEPVFTALFGRMLLGELTTGMEKVGGCLILTAAVVATLKQ